MHAYTCLIVDDSIPDALFLEQTLTDLTLFDTITVCSAYAEAFATLVRQQPYDLIFLEVELNGDNGLNLLSAVPQLPPVVVVSACDRYAVQCFDLNVADYIQKPITKERLLRSINRAINLSIDSESVLTPQEIFLKVGRRLQKFVFSEIDYIEAYGIYTKVYFRKNIAVVNEPIMALEKRLPTRFFRRVHKSYIINLDHVTAYNQNNFFIDEQKIPIGNTYRADLPNVFNAIK